MRISVGLGNLPQPFATNRVESINNPLKQETNGPLTVNQCVQRIKQFVERQHSIVRWAVVEKGSFKLQPDNKQYRIDPSDWVSLSGVYLYIYITFNLLSIFLFVYFL